MSKLAAVSIGAAILITICSLASYVSPGDDRMTWKVIRSHVVNSTARVVGAALDDASRSQADDAFEYIYVSGRRGCSGAFSGCWAIKTAAECSLFAPELEYGFEKALVHLNTKKIRNNWRGAPSGCFVSYPGTKGERLGFTEPIEEGEKSLKAECSKASMCVCKCPPAIDVAVYYATGISKRSHSNIVTILNYSAGPTAAPGLRPFRVHMLGPSKIINILRRPRFEVLVVPGGSMHMFSEKLEISGHVTTAAAPSLP